uniref:Carrier domain-containing protein n=1 Tax=Rhodopseudomonas palustris (strain DX-1) TaxID=652103 RepID=E6VNN5_RHOPX
MTREQITAAIRQILAERMNNQHLDGFGPQSRLNADLYLDSVLMLDLLLDLELGHGIAVPDDLVAGSKIETVGDLVDLLVPASSLDTRAEGAAQPAAFDVHADVYPDIKVHCVVSCLCDAVKAAGLDHRPMYFGIWDADFAVSERHQLRYHAPQISHDVFCRWFHRLYGVRVTEWYDHSAPKQVNITKLLGLIAARRPTESVMVMLDMFHLPERENKFNQNPFPHFLMVEATAAPHVWQVRDPDFRWEGPIERDRVLNAVAQPSVAGGYMFDRRAVRLPAAADIRDYFLTCFVADDNPLIRRVRDIVDVHVQRRDGLCVAELKTALRELPVLSIRKWAYEHGFAFFWRSLRLPNDEFLVWCDRIEELALGLPALHLKILRLAQTGDADCAADVYRTLDSLDALETAIKARLHAVFLDWCVDLGLARTPMSERRAGLRR